LIWFSDFQKHHHGNGYLIILWNGLFCVFEQEEIMEWWFNTEAGAEIPSEEDLIEKIKKKNMLGF